MPAIKRKTFYPCNFSVFNFRVFRTRHGWAAQVRWHGENKWSNVEYPSGPKVLVHTKQAMMNYLAYAFEGRGD